MGFGEAISSVFSKYATFSGRAMRSEFWWWKLFAVLTGFVTGMVEAVGLIWSLATFLPDIAVTVRRLHDMNRSGWWCLLLIVPAILIGIAPFAYPYADGFILFLLVVFVVALIGFIIWFCQEGTRGPNDFGEDPKHGVDAEVFA